MITSLAFSIVVFASQNSSSLNLTFKVPVSCQLINDAPKCNLELTKVNSNTWVDVKRGYKVTVDNGYMTIEEMK